MKILKILFFFFFSGQLWAINVIPITRIPSEAWVKLNCLGVVTPKYQPIVEQQIMTAHVKVNPGLPFPTFENLRDSNADFMKNLTKTCTERRWAKVILGSFTGLWLDWGTDWNFTRLEIGEEFVYNSNLCRAVGKPCERISQCCGYAQRVATCNLAAHTCESNAIEVSTNSTTRSSL